MSGNTDHSAPSVVRAMVLPPIYAINAPLARNQIQQLLVPERIVEASIDADAPVPLRAPWVPLRDTEGPLLVVTGNAAFPDTVDRVVHARDANVLTDSRSLRWVRHPALALIPPDPINYAERTQYTITSWARCFTYIEEDIARGVEGLRPPQIGAIHAAHMHWSTADAPATIVMPTGTGKTETMLSILLSRGCPRLLVVVPTDALRTQLAEKFVTLGVLKRFGVVSDTALYPIVGLLKVIPRSEDEVDALFARCNVIVSTSQIIGQCSQSLQSRMAYHCPYLFIDEAHHVGAKTWQSFKQQFASRRILQFTATPFRNDDKPVEGKIVFNYPLRKAMEEKYFESIRFDPVVEFDPQRVDAVIAAKAVARLREDCARYDHVLMARVSSKQRARDVHAIYAQYADFSPVQIHSGLSAAERERVRRMILNRETRIVVCVDMLGEGFDMPELKIAAFHDVRKSLPITLQLIGRFTRHRPDLGQPTIIANIGDPDVEGELAKLYSQDANWNALLPSISAGIIDRQVRFQEFLEGFGKFPDDIPFQTLRPALSTAIYTTDCTQWAPGRFLEGMQGHERFERLHYDINHRENTLVIVTARKVPVDWAQLDEVYNWDWELFVLHWDETQQLLFINSSGNGGYYRDLARAVTGENVELIVGGPIFRAFAGITRLKLHNVGLSEHFGKLIRYVMRAGSDVETGLTEAQRRNARKSNISGTGFEGGEKVSIGCSYKGRIWSHRRDNILSLIRWCEHVGRKVRDEDIDADLVLRGTLLSTFASVRPSAMPISVEWPDEFYEDLHANYDFVIDGGEPIPRYLAELALVDPSPTGDITFSLQSDTASVVLTLSLWEVDGVPEFRYSVASGHAASVRRGHSDTPIADFFRDHPPTIWFADGTSLEGNRLTRPNKNMPPYSRERICVWNWDGINIRKESQGVGRATDSVQYKVIQELRRGEYDVIFDDDNAGEAADVVAIKVGEGAISAELYHCKYAHGDQPGGRISDLYEVCGQAQKSVHWQVDPPELFRHLLRREGMRATSGPSRLQHGSQADLLRLQAMSRVVHVSLSIFIVQPGLARTEATLDQLQLLAVTENYLMDTYEIPLTVIGSETRGQAI